MLWNKTCSMVYPGPEPHCPLYLAIFSDTLPHCTVFPPCFAQAITTTCDGPVSILLTCPSGIIVYIPLPSPRSLSTGWDASLTESHWLSCYHIWISHTTLQLLIYLFSFLFYEHLTYSPWYPQCLTQDLKHSRYSKKKNICRMNECMKEWGNDWEAEVAAWQRRWRESSSHHKVDCPAFLNGKEWKR